MKTPTRVTAAVAGALLAATCAGTAASAEPGTPSPPPSSSSDSQRVKDLEAEVAALKEALAKLSADHGQGGTPAEQAPAGETEPPAGEPPAEDPPGEEAPGEQAPAGEPPAENAPSGKCQAVPQGPTSGGDQPAPSAPGPTPDGQTPPTEHPDPAGKPTTPAEAPAASGDVVTLPATGAPTDPGGRRVKSPNPSPVADAAKLTGPRIRIAKNGNPEELNGKTLTAGTVVEVERGAVFNDVRVVVNGNGTAAQPVLVTAVGTGPAPVFKATKAGDGKDGGIITTRGANVHLSGLALADSGSVGVRAEATGTVLNDITGTGIVIGTWVTGNGTKVWNSYWSKLRMMPDTPGPNDDYGAAGVVVEADDVTVEGVTCRDCIDVNSPDYKQYGGDGSFAEVWMKGNNLNIGWSYVDNSPRFLEAGGLGGGNSATNMKVHNSFGRIHKDAPFYFNDSGEYAGVDTSGFTETDNTIVKTG